MSTDEEQVIEIVKAYETGKPDSLILVVPKEVRKILRIEKGQKFYVKIDTKGRVIYETIQTIKQLSDSRYKS